MCSFRRLAKYSLQRVTETCSRNLHCFVPNTVHLKLANCKWQVNTGKGICAAGLGAAGCSSPVSCCGELAVVEEGLTTSTANGEKVHQVWFEISFSITEGSFFGFLFVCMYVMIKKQKEDIALEITNMREEEEENGWIEELSWRVVVTQHILFLLPFKSWI